MVARSTLLATLSILAFSPLTASSPWHSPDFTRFPSLFGRQDLPQEPDESTCVPSCDIDTCGSGSCSIAGSLTRRALGGADSYLDWFGSMNASDIDGDEVKHISKRFWKFNPSAKTPVGDREPTVGEVDRYLPAVFTGSDWRTYGRPLSLDDGDSRAVSQEVLFEDPNRTRKPFQIMTGGIHGCMTVTLVSNRAVWMAHFWESYSQGIPRRDDPAREPFFVERVLNFIDGTPVTRPKNNVPKAGYPGKPLPYIIPDKTSKAPTPDYFNDPVDDTTLYISTPIAETASIEDDNPRLFYAKRVPLMIAAFETRLGFAPNHVIIPYDRLNYDIPAEKALMDRSHRGMHLFQYDNNADKKGQRAWRYFAEKEYQLNNLP